jgi:hypothetical protein
MIIHTKMSTVYTFVCTVFNGTSAQRGYESHESVKIENVVGKHDCIVQSRTDSLSAGALRHATTSQVNLKQQDDSFN